MKKLLTLLLIFISSYSFAQKDSLPIPDTAKLTLGKVYSDMKSGIQGLATALKVPATHVYGIMIRQQTTRAISDLIFDLAFILLSIILYKVGIKMYRGIKDVKSTDEQDGIMVFTFILCGVSIFIAVCSFWNDYSGIVAGFFNPEYGAIKEIISFVK